MELSHLWQIAFSLWREFRRWSSFKHRWHGWLFLAIAFASCTCSVTMKHQWHTKSSRLTECVCTLWELSAGTPEKFLSSTHFCWPSTWANGRIHATQSATSLGRRPDESTAMISGIVTGWGKALAPCILSCQKILLLSIKTFIQNAKVGADNSHFRKIEILSNEQLSTYNLLGQKFVR